MALITTKTAEGDPAPRDLFFPVLLMGMALTTWLAFQGIQLLQEKTALANLKEAQEPIYNNAQKMRTQLEALAGGTAGIALQGNVNAIQIVEDFRKRGVTLSLGNATIAPASP